MRGRGVKFGTTAVHHLCIIPSRFALWLHCRDFPWKSAGTVALSCTIHSLSQEKGGP